MPRFEPLWLAVPGALVSVGVVLAVQAGLPAPVAKPEVAASAVQPVEAPTASASEPSNNASAPAALEDPFWPKPPAPKVEPPPPPVAAVMAQEPPPRPVLPYRYFGRMKNPAGREILMLARESEVVEAKEGLVLRDDFRVSAIEDSRVVFEHLPTGETLELSLPHTPRTTGVSVP